MPPGPAVACLPNWVICVVPRRASERQYVSGSDPRTCAGVRRDRREGWTGHCVHLRRAEVEHTHGGTEVGLVVAVHHGGHQGPVRRFVPPGEPVGGGQVLAVEHGLVHRCFSATEFAPVKDVVIGLPYSLAHTKRSFRVSEGAGLPQLVRHEEAVNRLRTGAAYEENAIRVRRRVGRIAPTVSGVASLPPEDDHE